MNRNLITPFQYTVLVAMERLFTEHPDWEKVSRLRLARELDIHSTSLVRVLASVRDLTGYPKNNFLSREFLEHVARWVSS